MLGWLRRLWGGGTGSVPAGLPRLREIRNPAAGIDQEGAGSVPARLRRLLDQIRSRNVAEREQAALALAEVNDERAAVALLSLMQDANPPVREAARAALRRLGE